MLQQRYYSPYIRQYVLDKMSRIKDMRNWIDTHKAKYDKLVKYAIDNIGELQDIASKNHNTNIADLIASRCNCPYSIAEDIARTACVLHHAMSDYK